MRFDHPHLIDDATAVFPANIKHLMPTPEEIPDDFWNGSTKWNKFQQDWFFLGISTKELVPKPKIDKALALRHLSAIQGSYEPKHEHKEAAVAYLASLWFEDYSMWAVKVK